MTTKPPDDNDRAQRGDLNDDPLDGTEPVEGSMEPDPDVEDLLSWKHSGRRRQYPYSTLRNAVTVFTHDPRWRGRLRRNLHAACFEVDDESISDLAESNAALWLDEVYGIVMSTRQVSEAMRVVANRQTFHPVRDYLGALEWDRVERLPTMLSRFWGVKPSELVSEIARCWMVGCVARVMQPGCQMDTTLILAGEQGVGKSSSIRYGLVPSPGWFSDARIDCSGKNKDTYALISGIWIYELAELEGMRRKQVDEVKQFLSVTVDRYRPSYGRNPIVQPRQTVFVGTTNREVFLDDATGHRRFWPVTVGKRIDHKGIARWRDQLWAEAAARYARKEQWHLKRSSEPLLKAHNEHFEAQDPLSASVSAFVFAQAPGGSFSVSQVLDHLKVPQERRSRRDDNRIAAILKECGCIRDGRSSNKTGRMHLWKLPQPHLVFDGENTA
ncbi:MAG: virulence-associated E family protein [Planctomycetota bacterium]